MQKAREEQKRLEAKARQKETKKVEEQNDDGFLKKEFESQLPKMKRKPVSKKKNFKSVKQSKKPEALIKTMMEEREKEVDKQIEDERMRRIQAEQLRQHFLKKIEAEKQKQIQDEMLKKTEADRQKQIENEKERQSEAQKVHIQSQKQNLVPTKTKKLKKSGKISNKIRSKRTVHVKKLEQPIPNQKSKEPVKPQVSIQLNELSEISDGLWMGNPDDVSKLNVNDQLGNIELKPRQNV